MDKAGFQASRILRTRPAFRPPGRGQGRFSGPQDQDFADKAGFQASPARFYGQGRFSGQPGEDFTDKAALQACKARISRTRPVARRSAGFCRQGRLSGQDFADKILGQRLCGQGRFSGVHVRATNPRTRPVLKPSGKASF